jgi:hypothetical protein
MSRIHHLQKLALCAILACLPIGCHSSKPNNRTAGEHDQLETTKIACFFPVKVQVLPLTKMVSPSDPDVSFHIHAYISLLDQFDSQIKTPGKFRFELYEKVLRSAKPKGKRIKIWEDVDLQAPGINHQYWQDYLRAYEFILDIEPQAKKNYILEITFSSATGRRFTTEYIIA